MPAFVIDGSETPTQWGNRLRVFVSPKRRYRITVEEVNDQTEQEDFENLMDLAGDEAKKQGMTPEVLEGILGTEVKHIL